VRCCTIDTFGNRQVFAFPGRGELVEFPVTDRWNYTAEAVDDVILRSVPRQALEQAFAVDVALRRDVEAYHRGLLARREAHLLTLATRKGPARLHRFLEEFAATRPAGACIVLPMPRRDIADHIGLSVESVSRAFSELGRNGLVELDGHDRYRTLRRSDAVSAGG
jgi:CRP-like cAMP-binding protein